MHVTLREEIKAVAKELDHTMASFIRSEMKKIVKIRTNELRQTTSGQTFKGTILSEPMAGAGQNTATPVEQLPTEAEQKKKKTKEA